MIKPKITLHFIILIFVILSSFMFSAWLITPYKEHSQLMLHISQDKQALIQLFNKTHDIADALQQEKMYSYLYLLNPSAENKDKLQQHYVKTDNEIKVLTNSPDLEREKTLFNHTFQNLLSNLAQLPHKRHKIMTATPELLLAFYQKHNQDLFNLFAQLESYLKSGHLESETVLLQYLFLIKQNMHHENILRIQALLQADSTQIQQQLFLAQANQKNYQDLFALSRRNNGIYRDLENALVMKNLKFLNASQSVDTLTLPQWLQLHHKRLLRVNQIETMILTNWAISNNKSIKEWQDKQQFINIIMGLYVFLVVLVAWVILNLYTKLQQLLRQLQTKLQKIAQKYNKSMDAISVERLLTQKDKKEHPILQKVDDLEQDLTQQLNKYTQVTNELVNMHNVFNALPTNLMLLDQQERIVYINQQLQTIFRQSQKDFEKTIPDFNPDNVLNKKLSAFYRPNQQRPNDNKTMNLLIGKQQITLYFNPIFNTHEKGKPQGSVVCWQFTSVKK